MIFRRHLKRADRSEGSNGLGHLWLGQVDDDEGLQPVDG